MLCNIFFFYVFVLCLSFIFSFILHPSCIIPLLISSFLSLIPLDCFVYLWQKGGEYTGLYCHFYIIHVHTLRECNSTLCTFVGGESHRGDAYTKGEKTFFFWENLVLVYACFLVVLWYLDMLCCSHSIASCLCVGHACIFMLLCLFGCMFGWSFALLYDHCSHSQMTVLVFDQVAHMFHITFTWSQFTCYIILVLFFTWFTLRV